MVIKKKKTFTIILPFLLELLHDQKSKAGKKKPRQRQAFCCRHGPKQKKGKKKRKLQVCIVISPKALSLMEHKVEMIKLINYN